MTMNDTWGYKSYDTNWKSPETLIRYLAEIVSKGGNFLLNVGPTALGEIPKPSVDRLVEIGKWLKINKESIYGTTASPFDYLSYGRCTRKGQKLYLHLFDYPANGMLPVPMNNQIKKAYLLARPAKKLLIKKEDTRSVISLPAKAPDKINTVVVVEFEGEPIVSPSPMNGKQVIASSQKSEMESAANLLDGDRLTRWQAVDAERKASLEVDLKQPAPVSCLVVDEPWKPWENKKQELTLQYKEAGIWKTVCKVTTKGIGHVENFKPVMARVFRLIVENKDSSPTLLEWQMYGPE